LAEQIAAFRPFSENVNKTKTAIRTTTHPWARRVLSRSRSRSSCKKTRQQLSLPTSLPRCFLCLLVQVHQLPVSRSSASVLPFLSTRRTAARCCLGFRRRRDHYGQIVRDKCTHPDQRRLCRAARFRAVQDRALEQDPAKKNGTLRLRGRLQPSHFTGQKKWCSERAEYERKEKIVGRCKFRHVQNEY
jgi:hypothetical protein